MVIDQGNYHIVDNDLKFTYSWEWTNLSTSAKSHLNKSVHFISNRCLKNVLIMKADKIPIPLPYYASF